MLIKRRSQEVTGAGVDGRLMCRSRAEVGPSGAWKGVEGGH